MAGNASKRDWVIEEAVVQGPDGQLHLDSTFDMDRARELLERLLGTLAEIGGQFAVSADRVKVAETPDGAPIAESRRLLVTWRSYSPLRDDDEQEMGARDDELVEEFPELDEPQPDLAGALQDAARAAGVTVQLAAEPAVEPAGATDEWAPDAELEGDVDTAGAEVEPSVHRIGMVAGGVEE